MKHYLLLCAFALLPALLWAQAGNPDSTFGTNGRKTIFLPSEAMVRSAEKGSTLYKVSDTKLLYVFPIARGVPGTPFGIIQTNADGVQDTAFGNNGMAMVDFGPAVMAVPTMVTVVENKIYIGGKAGQDMGIARLEMDGRLDTSWNHTGRAVVDFGGTNETVVGLNIYNSNPKKIRFAGSSDSTYAVGQLRLNGTPDLSFSTDGKFTADVGKGRMIGAYFGTGASFGYLAGYSKAADTGRFQFTVVKLNMSNQQVSLSRQRLTAGDNICHAVVANASSNDFIMVGECRDGAGVARAGILSFDFGQMTVNGSFATAGRTLWGLPGQNVAAHAVTIRSETGSTNYIIGGRANQGATQTAFLLRLDQCGYGDAMFGSGVYRLIPFGQPGEQISDIQMMGTRLNERIVAVGHGGDGLLWSKTKNNTHLRVRQGWFPVQSPTRINFTTITDGGNNYNLVMGDSGRFYRFYDAEDFSFVPPIVTWHRVNANAGTKTIRDYKSSASPNDYWMVGDSGFIAFSGSNGSNNTWGRRNGHTRQRLNSVKSNGSGTGYIAGDSGILLYSSNAAQTFEKVYTGTRQRLNWLLGSTYLVGDSGLIYKRVTARNWRRHTTGTTANLYGVENVTGGVTIAVGAGGTILRTTNDSTWTLIPSGVTTDLYSVSGRSNVVYACGAGGVILMSADDGRTWRRQESGTTEDLRCIISDGIQTATCVGDNGTVLRTLNTGITGLLPKAARPALDWALYPNPAAGRATASFVLERPGQVRLEMLDLSGRAIRTLSEQQAAEGHVEMTIPLDVPPGCYLLRLETQGRTGVKKLIVE